MSQLTEQLTKRYYTARELADMFNVNKSLVRYWEQEFDHLKAYRSSKGERRFTPENVRQFEDIYRLVKEQGYTLDGAKRELAEKKDFHNKRAEALKTLQRVRGFLEDLKNMV